MCWLAENDSIAQIGHRFPENNTIVQAFLYRICILIGIFRQYLILPGYRPLYTSSDILLNRNTVDMEEVEQYRKDRFLISKKSNVAPVITVSLH